MMEELRTFGHDSPTSSNSAQSAAEKIVRDADGHSPSGEHDAPVHETTSEYLGMKRKEAPTVAEEPPVEKNVRRVSETHDSSKMPAEDNPAPLSSALGIPTLVEDAPRDPSSAPSGDNPAPFSSALGIPTLIKESKRS